jgi:hypothetical protein
MVMSCVRNVLTEGSGIPGKSLATSAWTNRLEHLAAATAINVIRFDAWYNSNPIDRTRTTRLQRVSLTPAA